MRFRSRHFVDLSILSKNYEKLKKLCPTNEVIFMVKADAYGHGLIPIVRHSITELGIKEFGCATLGEALQLRDELNDLEFEIYVFSDVQLELKECAEIYLNRRIIPVISNREDFEFILSDAGFNRFPLCLKFNTGMNRLGLSMDEAENIARKLREKGKKSIFHLMTHFSSSSLSMQKNKKNLSQIENFNLLKSSFKSLGIEVENSSISNSGAIEQKIGLDETHVRPGIMMYGPSTLIPKYSQLSHWDGEIISKLETYVIRFFEVTRGQPIGYGATPCPGDGVVAIIALGYGDGFSTRFQGSHVFHKGKKGVIAGRVNMDMAQVFFKKGEVPDLKSGEVFTIWDHNVESFTDFAVESKTLTYEMTIQLTPRVPKIYG